MHIVCCLLANKQQQQQQEKRLTLAACHRSLFVLPVVIISLSLDLVVIVLAVVVAVAVVGRAQAASGRWQQAACAFSGPRASQNGPSCLLSLSLVGTRTKSIESEQAS